MVRALQPADPRLIGPYRLVGLLGSGGMGRVFLGMSVGGRPVAVKIVRAELAADPDFRSRFSREVAAARRVNGLFTALVVDADVEAPTPWLATAFVPGLSLAETVSDHGPLSAKSVLSLAAGLAEGLCAIHSAGVVHGDLKPSNVLLAEDGPRVIDFGISRAAGAAAVTHPGLVIGSPGYMSPEQALGQRVGPLSDVFSLGAVLAFAATGRRPFGTGSPLMLLDRVLNGVPDLAGAPAEVRSLAERCLAKDPDRRPTPEDLLAEVGAGQAEADWLPESIVRMIPREIPAARVEEPSSGVSVGGRPTTTLGSLPSDLVLVPGPFAPAKQPPPGDPHPPWPPRPGDGQTEDQPASGDTDQPRTDGDPVPGQATADQPEQGPLAGWSPADDDDDGGAQPLGLWRSLAVAAVAVGVLAGSGAAGFVVAAAYWHSSDSARVAAEGTSSPSLPVSARSSPAVASSPTGLSITSTYTYTKGAMVYVDIHYADPRHSAEGFGFVGVEGSGLAEENHTFAQPSSGIVEPGSVAYPFDQGCGTGHQSSGNVKVWINGTAGAHSKPVVVHLVCAG